MVKAKKSVDEPSSFWCSVPGSTADGRKKANLAAYAWMKGVTFHAYPGPHRNPSLRRRWLNQIFREERYDPGRHHRVCSLHFVDGCPSEQHPVPTLFPRNNFGEGPPLKRSRKSIAKREILKDLNNNTADCQPQSVTLLNDGSVIPLPVHSECTVSTTIVNEENAKVKQGKVATNQEQKLHTDHEYSIAHRNYPEYSNAEVQTDLSVYDINIMESESASILENACKKLKYWSGKDSMDDKHYEEGSARKPGPERKLTVFHEYLLTLLRIRQDLNIGILKDIFGISESRVSQIFNTWINYMYRVFAPQIKWPSMQKIRKYRPRSFKASFPNTRVIIDCTEVFIQKPRSPTAQSQTYSNYKNHNTFKALVGITPSGAFSFVSEFWGGNVSDRFITANSGFLDKISPGDEVMADRGFVIRDYLLERKAKLVIPPFTKKCAW
ncbi:uncharacterized protein LOC134264482 [Saccostrea cucullata]|uniref:uncharacterized protein LOC134264482 n=1 Tax=Saccostrea cuccullata TaxID=36930 RepID=UPI002ED4C194